MKIQVCALGFFSLTWLGRMVQFMERCWIEEWEEWEELNDAMSMGIDSLKFYLT